MAAGGSAPRAPFGRKAALTLIFTSLLSLWRKEVFSRLSPAPCKVKMAFVSLVDD
jgi:hypothetical protein